MKFIRTNNRKNFLIEDVPELHPSSMKYITYWKKHKQRCIEGFWSIDDADIQIDLELENHVLAKTKSDKWRYMPSNLYFYVNFGTILHQPEGAAKTAPKKKVRPHLRDVEWEFFYNWMECRGFSGFENDEEISCCREIIDFANGEIDMDLLPKEVFKEDGTLKEYEPARSYLRKYFDKPMGKAMWNNNGKNLLMLGSRGFGKDLEASTLVYGPEGPYPISDIKVDDEIYDHNGQLTKVLDRIDYDNQMQYQLNLSDGRTIECGAGHFWDVIDLNEMSDEPELEDYIHTLTLEDIRYNMEFNDKNYALPRHAPIDYNQPLLTGHKALVELALNNYPVKVNGESRTMLYNAVKSSVKYRDDLIHYVIGPDSPFEVLQDESQVQVFTENNLIARDLTEIIRSLGMVVCHDDLEQCVIIAENINPEIETFPYIVDIVVTEVKPSVCIAVDNKDNLFIAGDYIVTHNSFMVGVGVVLHELLFNGEKYYTKESIENPNKAEVFVGAAQAGYSSEIIEKTVNCYNNLPGVWAPDTEDEEPAPFWKGFSGEYTPNNKKNPWRQLIEEKVNGRWKKAGSGSNLKHGVYTTENPEVAAGGRYSVMVIEEVGLLPNTLKVHGSNEACVNEGTIRFGSCVYLGTGGNVEKIKETETIFYNPENYDFLEFDNIYENHKGKIGWFVPAYYANNALKDKNGNTNLEAAEREYAKRRERKRRNSVDNSALNLEKMNYPIKPSEMFLNVRANTFPILELQEQLATLRNNPHKYKDIHYFGELVENSEGELRWVNGNPNECVRDFPILDNKNKPGIIEIFEMPKKTGNGKVFSNRYVMGTDTYDDDESSTDSLGSVFVIDSYVDRVVAEYTGRRGTIEFYEIVRKLTKFYNGLNNYEQNKKGLFWHFSKRGSLYLLCETPDSLRDAANVKILTTGNKKYGTNATAAVNAYAIRLIKEWLMQSAAGEEPESGILNLHKIRSEGLLQELIYYDPNGNYDRISALGMLLILKEDRYNIYRSANEKPKVVKTLSADDFFANRYGG
jgi:hypothetical protein